MIFFLSVYRKVTKLHSQVKCVCVCVFERGNVILISCLFALRMRNEYWRWIFSARRLGTIVYGGLSIFRFYIKRYPTKLKYYFGHCCNLDFFSVYILLKINLVKIKLQHYRLAKLNLSTRKY